MTVEDDLAGVTAPPSLAEVRWALAEAGVTQAVSVLPPDAGSKNRHHVFLLDEVVVKFDQTIDGRRALRERSALELLAETELAVPSLVGHGTWRGSKGWVVMSRMEGSVPPSAALLAHAPTPGLAEEMGRVSARLHAGPTPPGFGTWARDSITLVEYHRRSVPLLAEMVPGTGLLSGPDLDRLVGLLGELRPSLETAPQTPVLSHRDMQARNVLVDRAGHLCALLDFETSGGGDPAEDFARIGLDWDGPGFASFCDGYAQAGGRLNRDAPARVAYYVLNWVLVIFAYVGTIVPEYLDDARRSWGRIEAGELPPLGVTAGDSRS